MMYMDVDSALSEVPVNAVPLIDDTDFKSIEASVAYNATGMDLVWNFVTTAGATSQTAVTPTTAGVHAWTNQGKGMYTLGIPATGGTINNDTEGFGYFSGVATGVLPWRGPTITFRAGGINNLLIDAAYSATRGLVGSALPDAAADAAGGLVISDAGALDIDAKLANTNEVTVARMGALTDWLTGERLDLLLAAIPTTPMRGTDGVDTSPMRGTDNAATEAKQDIIDANVDALIVGVAAIPTTPMRGTDGVDTSPMRGTDGVDTSPMRGTDSAATEAKQDIIDANVDAVLEDTGTTLPATLATAASLATVGTVTNAIKLVTDALPDSGALTSLLWSTALTESYRATGAEGTPAQLMYEILAHVGQFTLVDLTKTTKKLDGTTTAKTYTLDDATSPTSITEAT